MAGEDYRENIALEVQKGGAVAQSPTPKSAHRTPPPPHAPATKGTKGTITQRRDTRNQIYLTYYHQQFISNPIRPSVYIPTDITINMGKSHGQRTCTMDFTTFTQDYQQITHTIIAEMLHEENLLHEIDTI